MNHFFEDSVFFGVTLSFLSYGLGVLLKKKLKLGILNPLLVSIVITVIVLVVTDMDYEIYYNGAKYISYLLTPATVCLAIPLYEQFEILKKNVAAILAGILSGVLTSLSCILAMVLIFNMNHKQYVSLLPKSITTAIGMGVSEELGGYVAITTAIIIITGVFGNVIGEFVLYIFRIKEPVAKGIALGTASHAIGTAKAMELGEIEGALASLSIILSGIITVGFAPVFAQIH